jgi:hypothetical protein
MMIPESPTGNMSCNADDVVETDVVLLVLVVMLPDELPAGVCVASVTFASPLAFVDVLLAFVDVAFVDVVVVAGTLVLEDDEVLDVDVVKATVVRCVVSMYPVSPSRSVQRR